MSLYTMDDTYKLEIDTVKHRECVYWVYDIFNDEIFDLDDFYERGTFKGPRDLLHATQIGEKLELTFRTIRGLYFAMGYLTNESISYQLIGGARRIERTRQKEISRLKKRSIRHPTDFQLYVRPYGVAFKSKRLEWNATHRTLNLCNDLTKMYMKEQGRYAFAHFSCYETVWYLMGYFQTSSLLDVRLSNRMRETVREK